MLVPGLVPANRDKMKDVRAKHQVSEAEPNGTWDISAQMPTVRKMSEAAGAQILWVTFATGIDAQYLEDKVNWPLRSLS